MLWGIQESENCCALYLLGTGGGGGGGGGGEGGGGGGERGGGGGGGGGRGGGGGVDKRGNKLVSIQLSKPGTISQLYVLKINVEAHFVCYIPPSPFL